MTKMRLRNRREYWVVMLGALLVAALVCRLVPPVRSLAAYFTVVVGIWSVFYFVYQQQIEEARFFRELFTDFNKRYDDMNNRLQALLQKQGPLLPDEEAAFIDYFNLCAEEYMYWDAGYIDERVWKGWLNGMRYFGRDARVAQLWNRENATDSYYDFKFPCG